MHILNKRASTWKRMKVKPKNWNIYLSNISISSVCVECCRKWIFSPFFFSERTIQFFHLLHPIMIDTLYIISKRINASLIDLVWYELNIMWYFAVWMAYAHQYQHVKAEMLTTTTLPRNKHCIMMILCNMYLCISNFSLQTRTHTI